VTLLQRGFVEIKRRKRPQLWKNGFILHQNNAPAHAALSVQQFLVDKNIATLQNPLYSPDLAPCHFFLFSKLKSVLKETRFESIEAAKNKTTQVLKQLTENELQHAFDQWKIRMQRCVCILKKTTDSFDVSSL